MVQAKSDNLIKSHLLQLAKSIDSAQAHTLVGTVIKMTGMTIEVSGLSVPLGTHCKLVLSESNVVTAEVIGFSKDTTYVMATENIEGIRPGTKVVPMTHNFMAKVGDALLGRVIDSSGEPIDNKGIIELNDYYPLNVKPINPLQRKRIDTPLDVGVKAINALLTICKGQRLGIFSASGIGKSMLLGMMTRFTEADIVVVGLIGERGREVKEFIEEILGEQGLKKSVVVAAPADVSPLARIRSALSATTIAEYYRDKGHDVLLIVDSLTRYAQACREVSLSAGELPIAKGYTPSVFVKLSQLIERTGNGIAGHGSITALYTVLIEGDDYTDPISDHAKSVLDGHIYLSRKLADAGHYPAIDVERSISRVMTAVVDSKHLANANHFKKLMSAYSQNKDLINVGMYQPGTDKNIDEAIHIQDKANHFLKQDVNQSCTYHESIKLLEAVLIH